MAGNASSGTHVFTQNPIVRKLSRVTEYSDTNICTYKGILAKLVFFVLITAIGVGAAVLMNITEGFGGELIFDEPIYEDGANVQIYSNEIIAVLIASVISIISPLLAVFIRPTIPVTGSLFCASIGFLLAWAATTFADVYLAPVLLALVITLILVFTMGFLYGMGIITVTQKMKTFIMTAMISVCARLCRRFSKPGSPST